MMKSEKRVSRRVAMLGAAAAGLSGVAHAQTARREPPSVVTTPPRDFRPGAPPATYFNDPDILVVDPSFNAYVTPNSTIQRLWTGALWAEGPAWSAEGRYLVWSDIPNNRQMRWLEENGAVSVFRSPTNNSNGNSFDFEGRQVSCEHLTRRVVRYEHDGTITVIADTYGGKRLNSPNDVVAHPDGSLWFTDPPYGGQLYEGAPDRAGGPSNANGHVNTRIGQPADYQPGRRELPTNVYRWDPSGRLDVVVTEEQMPDPNGLCFSPDYKQLYFCSTGKGPGDQGSGGKNDIWVGDVATGKVEGLRRFSECVIDGVNCGPDGIRCDVDGNVWASSNAGRAIGYNGVTVWNPAGTLIGRIRTPEVVANICFGGAKRNRLFMAASQSIYAVYINTQGVAPA